MKILEKDSRIPLYYQLVDLLVEAIETGKLSENDALPSERELCDMYDISRATVRQAMLELEKAGHIYKVHGKGTFVSPRKLKQELLKFYSFSGDMRRLGKQPATKVVSFEIINCDGKIAGKLGIGEGEMVYKFTRLRLADGEPMMLQKSFVPYDRFPGITKEDLKTESMYDIFVKRFSAVLTGGEEVFQVSTAREKEAELLGVPNESPSMIIERTTYENKAVVEYTLAVARGDRFKYHVSLT